MPDKQERTKPHDPAIRKAAKARVAAWFDDPKHEPKPDDEPRNGTLARKEDQEGT